MHAGQVSNFLRDSQSDEASTLWEQELKLLEACRAGQLQEQHVHSLIKLRFQTFAKIAEIEALNRFRTLCHHPNLSSDAAAWINEKGAEVGIKDLRHVSIVSEQCKRLAKTWLRTASQ